MRLILACSGGTRDKVQAPRNLIVYVILLGICCFECSGGPRNLAVLRVVFEGTSKV